MGKNKITSNEQNLKILVLQERREDKTKQNHINIPEKQISGRV